MLCVSELTKNYGRAVADELRAMTHRTSLEGIFAQMTESDAVDTKSVEAIRVMTEKSDAKHTPESLRRLL